jgi:hypothetical protein
MRNLTDINKYVIFIMIIGLVHVTLQKKVTKVNKNSLNYDLVQGAKFYDEVFATCPINKSDSDFIDSILKESNDEKTPEEMLNEAIKKYLEKLQESEAEGFNSDMSKMFKKLFSWKKKSSLEISSSSDHPLSSAGNYH